SQQRTEGNKLSRRIYRPAWHRRAGQDKPWTNHAGKNRTDGGTRTAIVWRCQRVATRQTSATTARSEEAIRSCPANTGGIPGSDERVNCSRLCSSYIVEGPRHRIQTRDHRYRG